MGIIRFIQDHNRNIELKKMRQIQEGTVYHPSKNEYCQICGKPKGFQQFFLVTKENRSLNVCEECANEVDNEDTIDETKKSNDAPLNILKTRYAKGEITKEQYDQMKKDLEV